MRETIESVIVAFILAFIFRAYVVEAFVIPTGSMAPTLLGAHLSVTCSECGYGFDVDAPPRSNSDPGNFDWDLEAFCPMCHHPEQVPRTRRTAAGDRILVQKYVYDIAEPRRWDVIVFKAPDAPDVNFIKRLVGLPDEKLMIVDGNVYVQPEGQPDWRIARKTDREDVQRAVWQPVYHSTYIPLDQGDPSVGVRRQPWSVPWYPDDPGDWEIDHRRSYRHTESNLGAIYFNLNHAISDGPGLFAYNQMQNDGRITIPDWGQGDMRIEDVRVAAAFQPEAPGLEVRLSTTARIDEMANDPGQIIARILPDGHAILQSQGADDDEPTVRDEAFVGPFEVGIAREVELWYCDQEASLWIDGRKTLVWQYDLPMEQLIARPAMRENALIGIEVRHTPVTLHRVQVDRDIVYSSQTQNRTVARGTFSRSRERDLEHAEPVTLAADEFFALGDNSPKSQDSRYWREVNEWVATRMFEPGQAKPGVVPRELLMGRAFFVYFPALKRPNPDVPIFLPDFGRMRFIH